MSATRPVFRLPGFWTLQIGGWLIYYVMIYITFLTVAVPENFLRLLAVKGIRTLIGFGLTSVLRFIYRRFGNYFSVQGTVIFVLINAMIFGLLWTWLEIGFSFLINPNLNFYDTLARSPRITLDYAMTITAWSSLYLGIKALVAWQTERENSLASLALANQAQLELLRYQLNPHFLFNALNSLRATIGENPLRAKKMVTELADFLRYSLLSNNAKQNLLETELESVRNYLAIEKIRFEDKLQVKFNIEEEAKNAKVPCLLLNPLVENAIKHGFTNSGEPLEIVISALIKQKVLFLEVANNGKLSENGNGTHIGLKNLRERLERNFPDRSEFSLNEKDGWVRAQIFIKQKTF